VNAREIIPTQRNFNVAAVTPQNAWAEGAI